MTLMKLKDFAQKESSPQLFYQVWQDYKGAPMGANLQLIFYKNRSGNVLVKILHNEKEQLLELNSLNAPYYEWEKLKDFWSL